MKTVGITFDLERGGYPLDQPIRVPAPGDVICSVRRGTRQELSCYKIVNAREVRRRSAQANASPRFALRCRRIKMPIWKVEIDWLFTWYQRRRSTG